MVAGDAEVTYPCEGWEVQGHLLEVRHCRRKERTVVIRDVHPQNVVLEEKLTRANANKESCITWMPSCISMQIKR